MIAARAYARRPAAALFVATLALASTEVTTAGAASKVIGHGVRFKASRIFVAQGTAILPRTVTATIAAVPAQAVKVDWSLVCQKPNTADPAIQIGATSTSGRTTLRRAGKVKLGLPFKKPPTCIATVYATLARKGELVLRLVQT